MEKSEFVLREKVSILNRCMNLERESVCNCSFRLKIRLRLSSNFLSPVSAVSSHVMSIASLKKANANEN